MSSTLVVGATGYLGRYVVKELHSRGQTVRVLVRDRSRAERPGAWDAPSLAGLVAEWREGDVTDSNVVSGLTDGVDRVISCLGVTTQKADAWAIDYEANLAVLSDAERSGVGAFCYVNVLNGSDCPARLTRAKAAFATALLRSSVPGQVIDPPAYFSDMMEVFKMVERSGRLWAFDPVDGRRINPIHGADLAVECVDRVETGESGRWEVGGPQTFTWKELGELACATLGRRPKVTALSPSVLPAVLWMTERISPRRADMLRFLSWNMTHDAVGRPIGSHCLQDFWKRHAKS